MAYFSTASAPECRNPTGKNRVWEILPLSSKTHPANRRPSPQPRRKLRPTATKSASGIPYWPSRDPIEESGGVNLYGFVRNDGVNKADFLGKVAIADDVVVGGYLLGAAAAAYLATPSGQQMMRDLAAAAAAAAEATRCAAIKAACVAKCTACLPTHEYSGDKFYKCMAYCMSGSGCYGN